MPPDFIELVLRNIDAQRKPIWVTDVSFPLYNAGSRDTLTPEQEAELRIETAAWDLCLRRGIKSRWGTAYSPLTVIKQPDGSEVVTPDVLMMGEAALAQWTSRLSILTHPVMVARYADISWDLSPLLAPGTRRNIQTAKVAIDAYQETVRDGLSHTPPLDLARALDLALEISDLGRIEAVCIQLLEISEQSTLESGLWFSAARAFENQKKISSVHLQRMAEGLEARLATASGVRNGYIAEIAGRALVAFYKRASRIAERDRVLRVIADTYLLASREAQAGIAIAWLRTAATLLEDEHLYKDAEALRLEMERRGPEVLASMKTIQVEATIPMDEINEHLDRFITTGNPILALVLLAHSLIPKRDALRERLKRMDQEFPFRSFIHRSIVGRDGIDVASVGSLEDDPDGRMLEGVVDDLQFNSVVFLLGYRKVKEEYDFTVEQLATATQQSPLVTDDIQVAITASLYAYEEGDYSKTVSQLIPSLEGMLREFLKPLNIPTRKRIRNSDGVSELKNMNEILSDERVAHALGENFTFFMRAVYTEKVALNLRNEVAHGNLPADGFNEMTASLVVMSLFALAIGPHTTLVSQTQTH